MPAVVGVVVVALFGAADALACAACALAQEEARKAFVGTTWLLTFLPLALIGGVVWWLYDRARKVEHDERDAPLG